MLQEFLSLLFDVGMATCPVIGYVLQYRLVRKNESVGAFSIDICLVLLAANILRLNFYPFKPFETALIFQSLLMIAAQLVLLQACCSVKQESLTAATTDSGDSPPQQKFWRWSSFTQYWHCTLVFAAGSSLVSLIMYLLEIQLYGQLIGLVALMTQSMLILPQIIEIFRLGFGQGISYYLLALNLQGDAIKTVYFFYKDQPFQFKLCGVIQLILDVFIIAQISYYRIRNRRDEFQDEAQPNEKEMEGKTSPGEDIEGSLARSVVYQGHLIGDQIKTDSQTNLD